MRELRQLRLPQLVEARRKRESANASADSPPPSERFAMDTSPTHTLNLSQSSSSSDPQSPLTPTFSLRSHTRFPSSTSSLASSPTMRESLDGFGASKRPLTDVKEEPQERDEDLDMIHRVESPEQYDYNERSSLASERKGNSLDFPYLGDYDWVDSPSYDLDTDSTSFSKRRRGNDSPLAGMTSRLGSRFPSLSRKWETRKKGPSLFKINTDSETVLSRSRANSSRAPSVIESAIDASERPSLHTPPTSARSIHGEGSSFPPVSPIDVQKANAFVDEEEEAPDAMATTPLLPPVLAHLQSGILDEPVQSPLQSPKVADSPSGVHTPIATPHAIGLPSPPLSTKPSVSSFHRRQLLPATDIPPILLADPQDEWANKLGHANFAIHPEPYLPDTYDLATCKQLRSDWELARNNFMKHLARTAEHYSTTSKVHQLTEEKWAQIDAQWKRNNDLALSRAPDEGEESLALSKKISSTEPAPTIKIPSINGPRSEGKFPKVGDEGIVGPMVREKVMSPPLRPSKKRTFWKFLQGVLPTSVAFGRGK